jgi:kelch-like protein 10
VWELLLQWIDFDAENRVENLPKLMRGVRFGLLAYDVICHHHCSYVIDSRSQFSSSLFQYFMEKVKAHRYVKNNADVGPIVRETIQFLCNLQALPTPNAEMTTPLFALPRLPHEIIFAIGGWSQGSPQTRIETYDTRADRWVSVPAHYEDPAGPRSYHGTAVIGTKLYLVGGFNGPDYFNKCCRFDAVKKTWKEIAPMHNRRCYVSVTVANGIIYALGGYDGGTRLRTAERYCPRTNQWSMIAPMHFRRSDADACSLNGKIYITGGFNGQECLNTAEFYDPESNTWTLLQPMLSRRSGVSCVAFRTCIFVVGGFNGLTRLNTGEKYDTLKETWTPIREMVSLRSNFALEVIDDMIMAVGGFNGVVTISNCECYLPESNEWVDATDMAMIRSALTANVVHGLPNMRDYVHQNRHKLIEERRIRILGYDSSIMSFNFDSFIENSESVESIRVVANPEFDDESENEANSGEM